MHVCTTLHGPCLRVLKIRQQYRAMHVHNFHVPADMSPGRIRQTMGCGVPLAAKIMPCITEREQCLVVAEEGCAFAASENFVLMMANHANIADGSQLPP